MPKTEEQYTKCLESVRRHAEKYPERLKEQRKRATENYRSKPENRLKVNARKAVADAIRRGDLVRPSSCERCGVDCKPDYSKRLEVEWLCKPCHCRKDRRAA